MENSGILMWCLNAGIALTLVFSALNAWLGKYQVAAGGHALLALQLMGTLLLSGFAPGAWAPPANALFAAAVAAALTAWYCSTRSTVRS